jgi:hypothetical protein
VFQRQALHNGFRRVLHTPCPQPAAGWMPLRYFARNGVIVHFFEYLHFLKGKHREIGRLAVVFLHHRSLKLADPFY